MINLDGRPLRIVRASYQTDAVDLEWESFQSSATHIFAGAKGRIDVFRWEDGVHASRLYGSCQKAPTGSMQIQLLDHNRLLVLAMSSVSIWHFDAPRTQINVARLTPPPTANAPDKIKLDFLPLDPVEVFSFASKAANVAMRQMAATIVVSSNKNDWRVVAFYSGDHRCWTSVSTMGVRLPKSYMGERVYLPSTSVVLPLGSSRSKYPQSYISNIRKCNTEPDIWRKFFPGTVAQLDNEPIVPIYHMARLGQDSIFGPILFAKEIFDCSRQRWVLSSISDEDLGGIVADTSLHKPNYPKLVADKKRKGQKRI